MRRAVITFLAAIAVISSVAFALSVSMDVGEELNAELKTISSYESNGLYNISIELYNSGSIPYNALARLDLFDGEKRVFTTWADSREMAPGKKEYFDIYAMANETGNLSPRIRVYFANEVIEKWYPSARFNPVPETGSLKIENQASGKGYVEFDLTSDRDADVIILPDKYPAGWVFHYSKANLRANVTSRQRLDFEPDIMRPADVMVDVVSDDGGLYASSRFSIRSESEGLFAGIMSFFGSLFQS